MSDFELREQFPEAQVAIPFASSPDRARNDEFRHYYEQSGVAEWAAARNQYGELVEPRFLYVDPDGEHTVAWVGHAGLIRYQEGPLRSYATHHVVCDCAAEVPEEGDPREVQECDYVQAILGQRAFEVGRELGVDAVIDSLSYFDEEAIDLRPNHLGQELIAKTIANILEIDKLHPQRWMANRVSGLHDIAILAAIVRQGTAAVMPLLEDLEQIGMVKMKDSTVRLDPRML